MNQEIEAPAPHPFPSLEHLYREAARVAGVVPYYCDHRTGRYEFIGEGMEGMIGWKDQPLTRDFLAEITEEIVPSGSLADLSLPTAIEKARAQEGIAWTADYRIRDESGASRWLSNRAIQVKDDSGQVVGSLGIFQDITASRVTEEALQKSHERFSKFFQSCPDAVTLVSLEEGNLHEVNETFCEWTGYDREEILGKSTLDFRFWVNPEKRNEFVRTLQETGSVRNFEGEFHTKQGQQLSVLTSAEIVEIGGTPYILAVSRDITEIKQAQHALHESELRFRKYFELDLVGMAVSTLDREWLDVNAKFCDLLGYSLKEIDTRSWADLAHPDDLENDLQFLQAMGEGTIDGYTVDKRFVRKDGSICYTTVSVRALRRRDGRIDHIVSLVYDITDRKKAELKVRRLNRDLEKRVQKRTAELEAANKELEAFSYSVSHDLRAPIRAMEGFTKILKEDYSADWDPTSRRYLDLILKNTKEMGNLIDDLLGFSRLNRQVLRRQHIDMAKLVERSWEDLQATLDPRSVRLEVGELPPCSADPTLVKQVLVNLLSNAIKFTGPREDGQVRVQGEVADGESVYSVSDNGVGFDMRYANKLFGVFQRLHRQEDFPGTGVGLAIAHRVVSRHGGRIWAESELEKGATFWFSLRGEDNDE